MTNPIEIVQELRRARGTLAKKRILQLYKHNDDWLKVLKAMYDTSINYYTSAPRDKTFKEGSIDIPAMLGVLDDLSNRVYTGNAARSLAEEASREYGEIFRLILDGSLRAGISTATLNAVYPGLIPTFKVMLAKDVEKIRYPLLASTKFDGVRLVAFVQDEQVILKTRQGKVLHLVSLRKQLQTFPNGVYDGELVSGAGLQAGRTKITGQVNRILKGTANEISDYTFAIFDYLTLEEWQRQVCETPYHQRYEFLQTLRLTPSTLCVEQIRVETDEHVQELFVDHLERGFEGLILRKATDRYVWKRSDKLIKRKAIKDAELYCTAVIEGNGKYAGMLGALVCQGKVEGCAVKVKVGTGFSDHDRERPFEDYLHKRIEIAYNDITQAKDSDAYSLFLPRFKRIYKELSI